MEKLSFDLILKRIKEIDFGKVDAVIAIAKGGIIPAAIIRNLLDVDMEILWLNLRDKYHIIIEDKPILKKEINFKFKDKNLLVVDDVSRTGATLKKAKELLKGNNIKTFVINGEADFSIINQKECVSLPWSLS